MTTQPSPSQEPEEEREPQEGGKYLTLLEHLRELRNRLLISAVAVALATGASFYFTGDIIEFLVEPAENKSDDFELIFTEPLGYIGSYFRVALLGGLVLAMPILIYQVLRFVSPALTREEKRWVLPTVFGASISFLLGTAFAFYVMMPPAIDFLFNFGGDLATPRIRIGPYIDFVTRLIFLTGVVFEIPLVVMFMARIGVTSSRKLIGFWRLAIILAFVLAAIVTPTIDPVTQSLVAGPIITLYGLGIVLARFVERPRP
ncbi:MAG: twin-arginine translocase subunit TatC [Dehalococcoidia bacterium]